MVVYDKSFLFFENFAVVRPIQYQNKPVGHG
jgi:hypothetical protein